MSDATDHIPPEDEQAALAAEYALGVLSAEERRAVETRMALEPPLARDIAAWEERLSGFASFVTPVPPPARTWMRIEAMMSLPPGARMRSGSLWDNVGFWRALGLGATGFAAACLAALAYLGRPAPIEQGPQRTPLMATLGNTATKQPNFVATIGADGSLTIVPAALLTTDKRSMELWLIPPGGQPHSLGLIAPGQPVRINVPADLLPQINLGATLAVSLEPPGGSPTGQPTGPVVAAGDLTRL